MAGYSEIIGRPDLTDELLPDQWINEILQTAPEDSVVLARAKTVRMSTKRARQPVLASLPDAYWVDKEPGDEPPPESTPDAGLKQTSKVTWKGIIMQAEELAVIVPIPDALVDDALVPLWPQVQPLLKEAIGNKVDQAALFGTDKPDSWPEAIIPGAIAAGNVESGDNLADAFLKVAQKASKGGFAVNGFITEPGLNWHLRGLKDAMGQYLFGPPTQGGNATLFGFNLDECRNGAWDREVATGVALDWSKFVVGIRQDITYDLFREGVITDPSGKVLLNLMQQDCKALRVVFRVAFQVAVPMNRLGGQYPAGVITPAAGSGGGGEGEGDG